MPVAEPPAHRHVGEGIWHGHTTAHPMWPNSRHAPPAYKRTLMVCEPLLRPFVNNRQQTTASFDELWSCLCPGTMESATCLRQRQCQRTGCPHDLQKYGWR